MIEGFLNGFTLDNALVLVSSKSFEGKTDQTEEIFSTKYTNEDIPAEYLAAFNAGDLSWKASSEVLDLPPKNTLIPTNFDIVEGEALAPANIRVTEESSLWHQLDTEFKFPKIGFNLKVKLQHRGNYVDPKSENLKALWVQCFNTEMSTLNYLSEMAKSYFDTSKTSSGLEISGKCYSDSLEPYLVKLIAFL